MGCNAQSHPSSGHATGDRPAMAGAVEGLTGHAANRLLGRSGAFWQDESYDHLVRDSQSFDRIRHYIEWNPVKAGLAGAPEEFAWSSATPPERAAGRGRDSGCPLPP